MAPFQTGMCGFTGATFTGLREAVSSHLRQQRPFVGLRDTHLDQKLLIKEYSLLVGAERELFLLGTQRECTEPRLFVAAQRLGREGRPPIVTVTFRIATTLALAVRLDL
jgi:hypothetical protein